MSGLDSFFTYLIFYFSGAVGSAFWFYFNKPIDRLGSRIVCAAAISAIMALISYIFCDIFFGDYFARSQLNTISSLFSMAASYRFHVVVSKWWGHNGE